jgi:four helix bundle protein
MNKFDLEERLIDFSVQSMEIAELLLNSFAGRHLACQLLRSGTSSALNYGEAQGSESQKDFLHKMKVVLKELRESHVCLKIIKRKGMINKKDKLEAALNECNELISIFVSSCRTAEQNLS